MRISILFISFLLTISVAHTQNYKIIGKVSDQKDHTSLIGASVTLKSLPDSNNVSVVTSNTSGQFSFNELKSGSYVIISSYLGYKTYKKAIEIGFNPTFNLDIELIPEDITLKGVEIVGRTSPVTIKGDTSEIRATQFKVNPDATAEDLVTKMPGIQKVDGKIQAQGEDVKRVMVDGAVFFGTDPSATLKNMPAEMVDKVQIFDKASDQAQFTGISDGNEEKTINIVTKPDYRQGKFGRVFAGYAPDDKYKAGGVYNQFNNASRLTIIGQSNNVNEQNFSSDDLSAMETASGGGQGHGPRRWGRSSPFSVDASGGIVTTHALGINYSDKWADKVTFQGSVFGNLNNINLLQTSYTDYFTGQNSQDKVQSNSDGQAFRFNSRVEYNIDSTQSLIYRPTFRYGYNDSKYLNTSDVFNGGIALSKYDNNSASTGKNMTLENELLYRKKLNKPGRTISFELEQSYTNSLPRTDQNLYTVSFDSVTIEQVDKQYIESNNYNKSYSAEIDYTEPLAKKHFLVVGYEYTIKDNDIDKRSYDLGNGEEPDEENLITNLSNVTDNLYQSHRPSLDYRYQDNSLDFSVGAGYQYSLLNTQKTFPAPDKVHTTFENILPSARIRYRISKTKNFRLFYRASTQEPSVSQLQGVIDNSNTLQLTSGNPLLNQSTSHRLWMHISSNNPKNGNSLFIGFGGQTTANYIASRVIYSSSDTILAGYGTLPAGARYTYPINLNGYYNLRGFASLGFPFYLIKSNINFNLRTSYINAPSQINNLINHSISKNLGGGVTISSNFSHNLDFTLSTQINFSDVDNDINTQADNTYFSQNASGKINWIFLDHFVLSTDATYYYNRGLESEGNTNYTLWNAGFGYKFLKKNAAEVRLQAFDILNNNTALTRNVTETYYSDVSTNVLNRYFMLMLSYKF
ncbi:MAG: TonB-dependent receptor [Saprospiraceae bacterium]|nr:TonB-dependent receptor [Saprospiraceae bacterium]